jgi:N-acetylmuramoyl-L-alanine amidase
MTYKIALSAGHGPHTKGKRTPLFEDGTFMHEHEFNNSVVNKLYGLLLHVKDFNVTIVSDTLTDVPLSQRVYREQQIVSDLFLAVHANAIEGKWNDVNGIESFYNNGSTKGRKYCGIFQANLIEDTGLHNRGAKSAPGPQYNHSLYVLKNTYGPAVLVECGFMDNKGEAIKLMSDEYRDIVAESLFRSTCQVFNIKIEKVDYKRMYFLAKAKLDKIMEVLK